MNSRISVQGTQSSHSTRDSSSGKNVPKSTRAAQKGTGVGKKPLRTHPLCRAIQALYVAESMDEATASLTTETADEKALKDLAQRSREMVPALDDLRSRAVDRKVLSTLTGDQVVGSDGEESEYEFGLSCSSAEEEKPKEAELKNEDKKSKKAGLPKLVLPIGWSIEKVCQKNGKAKRVFVDPNGRRFAKEEEAKLSIEISEKGKRMMAQWLADRRAASSSATATTTEIPSCNVQGLAMPKKTSSQPVDCSAGMDSDSLKVLESEMDGEPQQKRLRVE